MAKKDVFAPVDTDHPAFRSWFGKSVLHDNGVPRTYYHGTSKDADFKKFKMSRHGVWMTTEPEEASKYAIENDSQGFRAEGWSVKPTNTASRVIPVHARIEKPFVGEMPKEYFQENYKKSQSDWFDALRSNGYDGWVPKSQDGKLAVALSHPGQIKSALSNTGDYFETGDINKAEGGSVDDQSSSDGYASENDLLQPIGKSKMVGEEKPLFDEGVYKAGLSGFSSNNKKSIRYLHHDENDNPIGSLQIMTDGPRSKKATIQNVYVAENFRRNKIASGLLKRARQDFDVRHSTDLTNAGRAFARAVKAEGGSVEDYIPHDAPRRARNLKKFHGKTPDAIKNTRWYHGTNQNFQAFQRGKSGAIFVSPDPEFASFFATDADREYGSPNVMPVHVRAEKPFDYENVKHLNALAEALGPQLINDPRLMDTFNQVREGFWGAIEDRAIQNGIRSLGHDSFFVKERDESGEPSKNLAVYDPSQLKSATGNNGNFAREEDDITKAEGGQVVEKYHGTDVNNLTAFDPSKSRTAKYHYLADRPETAQNYGEHVYSVKLKPKNMISFHPENIGLKQSKVVNELAERLGEDPEYLMNAITSADGSFYGGRGSLQDSVMDELKDMGYDAVRFPDVAHGGSWDMSTVVLDNNIVDNIEKHAGEPAKADGGPVDDDEDEGITAYHGSPYDFPKFDISKIGTGEGNATYGHGLYFAGNENVAKEYREQLTNGTYQTSSGQVLDPYGDLEHLNIRVAAGKSIDNAIDRAHGLLETQPENADMIHRDLAKLMEAKAQDAAPRKGHMYEVRIKAHPDHFLDWDEVLEDQNDYIKNALHRVAERDEEAKGYSDLHDHLQEPDAYTGGAFYHSLAERGREKEASEILSQMGIKGIRYKDAASRFKNGEPSYNYVVFNHDHVDIKRKYARGGAIDAG